MKKTYISPVVTLTRVQTEMMMALSTYDTDAVKDNEVLVKGDRSDRGYHENYNVWNDDWSK